MPGQNALSSIGILKVNPQIQNSQKFTGHLVQADLQIVVEDKEGGVSRAFKKRCKEIYGVIKTCQQE